MTPEKLEHARRIVEAVIGEQIGDVVFHKILVKPDLEKYDDDDLDYLEVRAVYEGEWERIGAKRSVNFRVALRRRLYDEGITEFPLVYMTSRSDWDQYPEPE